MPFNALQCSALAAEGNVKPAREPARQNQQTYFATSQTWGRRALFRAEPWAELFINALLQHRQAAYLLHEFVVMPDHFHALITPMTSLERAVQLVKGGFSYRAKKELASNLEIWQRGFTDHRIRDADDYQKYLKYIHQNPVAKHLCARAEDYPYSSASRRFALDAIPQRLKPLSLAGDDGTAKAVPLQRIASVANQERVDNRRERR